MGVMLTQISTKRLRESTPMAMHQSEATKQPMLENIRLNFTRVNISAIDLVMMQISSNHMQIA